MRPCGLPSAVWNRIYKTASVDGPGHSARSIIPTQIRAAGSYRREFASRRPNHRRSTLRGVWSEAGEFPAQAETSTDQAPPGGPGARPGCVPVGLGAPPVVPALPRQGLGLAPGDHSELRVDDPAPQNTEACRQPQQPRQGAGMGRGGRPPRPGRSGPAPGRGTEDATPSGGGVCRRRTRRPGDCCPAPPRADLRRDRGRAAVYGGQGRQSVLPHYAGPALVLASAAATPWVTGGGFRPPGRRALPRPGPQQPGRCVVCRLERPPPPGPSSVGAPVTLAPRQAAKKQLPRGIIGDRGHDDAQPSRAQPSAARHRAGLMPRGPAAGGLGAVPRPGDVRARRRPVATGHFPGSGHE
jgi:hypothetical protein